MFSRTRPSLEPHFAWLDDTRRVKAKAMAWARGVDCIRKISDQGWGTLAGWCQQHDETTLEDAPSAPSSWRQSARGRRRRSCGSWCRSSRRDPNFDIGGSATVAWLKRVRLSGIRVDKVKALGRSFSVTRPISTPSSSTIRKPQPLWAGHYEIEYQSPCVRKAGAASRNTHSPESGGNGEPGRHAMVWFLTLALI